MTTGDIDVTKHNSCQKFQSFAVPSFCHNLHRRRHHHRQQSTPTIANIIPAVVVSKSSSSSSSSSSSPSFDGLYKGYHKKYMYEFQLPSFITYYPHLRYNCCLHHGLHHLSYRGFVFAGFY